MIFSLRRHSRCISILIGVSLLLAGANHATLCAMFTTQGQAYERTSIAQRTIDDTVASKPRDNVAGGCDDTLTIRDTVVCGDVVAHVSVRPIGNNCKGIHAVYAEQLSNYEFVVDSAFRSGDSTVTYWLRVIEKTQVASARILTVTRSGRYIEAPYDYVAGRVQYTPDRFNFGSVADADLPCAVVGLTNATDQDIRVDSILIKNHVEVFRVTPTRTIVPAKSSVDIEVCVDLGRNYSILDTLVLRLGCFDMMATEFSAHREVPRVKIGDQNWGTVPADQSVRRPVVIQNVGTLPVIIYDYDRSLLDPARSNFYNPLGLDEHLPLSLAAGSRHTYTVVYSPKGEIDVEHRLDIPFLTNASMFDTVATLIGKGGSPSVSVHEASTAEALAEWFVTNEAIVVRNVTPGSSIVLVDLNGRELLSKYSVDGGTIVLPRPHGLASGLYLVVLTSPAGRRVVSIML